MNEEERKKLLKSYLIGYYPKRTVFNPEWLKASHVKEICSASGCISKGPKDWNDKWKFNEFYLYDSPETAATAGNNELERYDIYAFKRYPVTVDEGEIQDESIPELTVTPLPEGFEFLGYDAVEGADIKAFECSPLSCNYGARSIPCNSYCLFDSFDDALKGALEFSRGGWEPGPYSIVEVYREISGKKSNRPVPKNNC